MTDILALLQNIAPLLEKTTYRRMSQVIFGMLVASGRITMLGLSRWTENGGSYRTIQRFYHSVLPWKAIQWLFFRERFLVPEDEYIAAGDEVVVSKAGKETHGLDRFFSGECAGRTLISTASRTSCEKRRRKGGQQNQSRSEKGQENG